jgi:tripartite-type tricarboxylate transporter receptor subunit TctC
MTMVRRRFLQFAAGAAAWPMRSTFAWAQAYPSRPVRIIVGYAAGGAQDIVARLIGQSLSARLGQPFVVENRPGAGGNIATESVVKAAPDGYTLLLLNTPDAINATLYDNLNYNVVRDIAPVADVAHMPGIMVMNPALPPKTVPEFVAYTKANPGKVNMASAGVGSSGHLAGELFKMMTGADMVHVPYRGGAPALADLLGGQVQVFFGVLASSMGHIRAGRLRALAVTTATRSPALPDVPAVAESVPGYEASGWSGIAAPKDTPKDIIDTLNQAINAALADPKTKAQLVALGGALAPGSPADFARFVAHETEKWRDVVRSANVKSK